MDSKDVEEIFKGVLTDETPQTTEYQNPPPTPAQPVPSGNNISWVKRNLNNSNYRGMKTSNFKTTLKLLINVC